LGGARAGADEDGLAGAGGADEAGCTDGAPFGDDAVPLAGDGFASGPSPGVFAAITAFAFERNLRVEGRLRR